MIDAPRIAVVGSDVSLVVGLTMAMPHADITGYGTPEEVEGAGLSAVVLSAATTGECLDLAERLGLADVPCVAIGDEAFDGPGHFEVFTRPLNRGRLVEHLRALVAASDATASIPTLPASETGGGGRGVLGFLRRPRGRQTDVPEPPAEAGAADERLERVVEVVEPEPGEQDMAPVLVEQDVEPEPAVAEDVEPVDEEVEPSAVDEDDEDDAVDEDGESEAGHEDDRDDAPADPDVEVGDGEAVSDPPPDLDAADSADELAVASTYVAEAVALAAGVATEPEHEVEDDEPDPGPGPQPAPEPQHEPQPQPETQPEPQPPPAAVEADDPAALVAIFADLNAPLPEESPQVLVEHLAAGLGVETAVVWEAGPDGHLSIVAASGLSRLERRAWIPREHVLATLMSRGPGGAGHAVLDTTAGGVVRLSTHDPRLRNVVGIGPAVNLALVVKRASTPRLVVVAADDVDAAAFAAAAT